MSEASGRRYALYLALDIGSAWWQWGSRWLGRCAATGKEMQQPIIAGYGANEFSALTEQPRKYGFHATLKAPFHLAAGQTRDALIAAVREFCAARPSFRLAPLKVAKLDDFLALVPIEHDMRVDQIAAGCVRSFDRFRAPPQQRRKFTSQLSARQQRHFEEWGYPYVFADFRFHMTLTGGLIGLARDKVDALFAAARVAVVELNTEPPAFDAVCVFEQPDVASLLCMSERISFSKPGER